MTINISVPEQQNQLKPRITVIGVGGAGGNAVNNMIQAQLEGVEFVTANTDSQALAQALAERVIQLGPGITHGLGAGSRPDIGRAAAEEAMDDLMEAIGNAHMVFITAGMGGGTGTGAAPVIARLAREHGILTVGVVTKPFQFEGINRMRIAEAGIEEMQQYVDTLIVIPNQNLFRVANEKTTFADAFSMADEVLHCGVRGVTDLMVVPGLINLDFADIRAVMSEMGKAMMGTGEGEGEDRARLAAEAAISNPLLDDVSMKGARGVLINITGGPDMTLFEVDEAANRIGEEVDPDANIIFGSTMDQSLDSKLRVSVVATGIDVQVNAQQPPRPVLKVYTQPQKLVRTRDDAVNAETPAETPAVAEAPNPTPAAATPAAPVASAMSSAPTASAPTTPPPGPAPRAEPASAAMPPRETGEMPAARTMSAAADQPGRMPAGIDPGPDMPRPAAAVAAAAAAAERHTASPQPSASEAPEPEPQPEEALAAAESAARPEPRLVTENDAFMPPPPYDPRGGAETAGRSDPFREADLLNGGSRGEPRRRGSNLFQRITGSARDRREEDEAPAAERRPRSAAPTPPPAARSAQEAPKASEQPRLSGVDPEDRLKTSQSEDDLLDIPAFLRRQAN